MATTRKLNWKQRCNSIAFGIGYKSVRQVSSMTFRSNNGSIITEIGPRLQNLTDYSAPAVSWRIVKLQFLEPYYLLDQLISARLNFLMQSAPWGWCSATVSIFKIYTKFVFKQKEHSSNKCFAILFLLSQTLL